jgi:hypothetical protein
VAASRHPALRGTRRAARVGPAPQTGTPPRARQGGGSVAGVGLRRATRIAPVPRPRPARGPSGNALRASVCRPRRARREIRGGGTGEGLRAGRPASRSARPYAARAAPAHSPIPQSGSPDPIRIPEPHLAPARAPGRGQRSGGGLARGAHHARAARLRAPRGRSPRNPGGGRVAGVADRLGAPRRTLRAPPRARAVRQRATRVRPPPAPRSPRNPGRGHGAGVARSPPASAHRAPRAGRPATRYARPSAARAPGRGPRSGGGLARGAHHARAARLRAPRGRSPPACRPAPRASLAAKSGEGAA